MHDIFNFKFLSLYFYVILALFIAERCRRDQDGARPKKDNNNVDNDDDIDDDDGGGGLG